MKFAMIATLSALCLTACGSGGGSGGGDGATSTSGTMPINPAAQSAPAMKFDPTNMASPTSDGKRTAAVKSRATSDATSELRH